MRYLLALALLMACGCDRDLVQRAHVTKWDNPGHQIKGPRYTIRVTWDCDSLPDTLKVAIPR